MAQYVRGLDRTQPMLLPASVDDYVPPESQVRVLDAFVESLDLENLGFKIRPVEALGRSSFDPGTLIKIYLWGYLHRTRSSRRLEKACATDLTLIWLTGDLRPDHSTISDFRKDHPKALKNLFREFNLLCRKLELFGRELLAIDGAFFKGVNSKTRSFTKNKLTKMLEKIDANIERYIARLDQLDKEEAPTDTPETADSIREKITAIEARRAELNQHLTNCEKSPTGQISLTDPDSVSLNKRSQSTVGYNVQSAVDDKNHLIIIIEATQDNSDQHQLIPISRQAKADLGLEPDAVIEVLADTGYHSGPGIATCDAENTVTYIPPKRGQGNVCGDGSIRNEDFIYDEGNDRYQCPQGKYLARKSDLKRSIGQSNYSVYYTVSSCRGCPLLGKCTAGKYRKLRINQDRETLNAAAQRMKDSPEKARRRGSIVEHPFGTLKDNLGRNHFLCRGLEKVGAEISLSALAYNLNRVIKLLGVSKLLEAIALHSLIAGKECA